VSKVVGEKVYDGMQESAPQWAEGVAITSSLLAALVAGVGVGWLVRSIFGKLERTQISKLS
jgi:F0F1-type ATP synthase assembly protein I